MEALFTEREHSSYGIASGLCVGYVGALFRLLRGRHAAAHTAAAAGSAMTAHAAAHLARIAFRTVVGGDIAAVIGVGAVAVQRRVPAAVAGQVQGAAVDGQIAVGIHTVPRGHNRNRTAVDEDKTVGAVIKGIRLPSAETGAVRPPRRR